MAVGILLLTTSLLMTAGLQDVESARILGLLNFASPSHHIFNRVLIRALAARGHQVTVISTDVDADNVPNLTTIKIDGVYETLGKNYDFETFGDQSDMDVISSTFGWVEVLCKSEFRSDGTKQLLNFSSNEQFDLIITEASWAECFYGFIHKFGSPPVVAVSGYGVHPWSAAAMGVPDNPSYMPVSLLPYSSTMTLTQKIYNSFIHYYFLYKYEYEHLPKMEAMAKEFFKQDMPSFMDIHRNFSLILANIVLGLDEPRPLTPNIIPIGGMHVKMKANSLPKDLQKYLDEAKDGFIYFSLGTNIRSDTLNAGKLRAFMDAFSELPQRILWKFESDNLQGLPSNVKIRKWLPQSDILAHPNIRLFITHCGRMSTTETVYRGVPIVGIPFFLDQVLTIQKVLRKGIGVYVDYHTLTKESILQAIREVLNNASYEANMKKISAVLRDQPESALNRAVFWTEYVIRHKGAPHLRSAATKLNWYEYLLLDVLLVVSMTGFAVILVVYKLLRKIYNLLRPELSQKVKRH